MRTLTNTHSLQLTAFFEDMHALMSLDRLSTCDEKGIKKLTVCLSDLKDFEQPIIEKKRWGKRRSELTVHVTPLSSQDVEPLCNDLGWYNYLMLFAMTWIFGQHDRAFRIHTYFGYSNLQDETPFEKIYTADFIEFGEKGKTPQSLIKLSKCLKKLEGDVFSPAVYETLNQNFPNYVSKKNLKGSESFWIQFESNLEPTIEFSKTKPTWLDSGIDLKVDSVDAPSEWMNDIIWCFTFLAKMYPEFGIVLKQVENEDTKLIFFIRRGNLSDFSIFLGTFNNFPKEIPKESTSVAVAKAALGFVPIVGSCMTIKDSIDAFKTGNPKTGCCCLALGAVGLVADAFIIGGPLVSLTAKVASRSTKVVSACAKITEATATATKVSQYSKNVISIGQEVAHSKALTCSTAEPASLLETVSDVGLLKIVFPRLAEDILSEPR